jgi:2-oxo-4-hydroxy-4-carboxy--5-ureidoimidazoline (OHCU) decarboxylase
MIGGAWAGITLGDHLPSLIMVPLVLIFGAMAGALWIFVPAFVRSRLGTSEIVSTLLLTYVASSLIDYVIYTPDSFFRNPNTSFPQGRLVSASAKLQSFGDTRLYPTIFVAIILAVVLYWVIKRTEFGYRINVIADSPKAAHYAGINAKRTTMSVLQKQAEKRLTELAIKEQVTEGGAALSQLLKQETSRFRFPSFLSFWASASNKTLSELEQRVGAKTMFQLTQAMKTPEGAANLLETLPASERNRVINLMTKPQTWKPGAAAATGVAIKNALAPEESQNALAR